MVGELVVAEVGSGGGQHVPPGGSTDSGGSDIAADAHVAEEQPAGDEGLLGGARRLVHDVQVGRVEAEGGGREAVSDQVHPEQLDGDQSLRSAQSSRQEDAAGGEKAVSDQVHPEQLDGNQSLRGAQSSSQEDTAGGRRGWLEDGRATMVVKLRERHVIRETKIANVNTDRSLNVNNTSRRVYYSSHRYLYF